MTSHRHSLHRIRLVAAMCAAAFMALFVVAPLGASASTGGMKLAAGGGTLGNTGLAPGDIQHVFLIILENKSYDETFTGLNNNSYLWQTLPSEGVLLKNYYGTGHSSQDNYIALVSGQGPEEDVQNDCSNADTPFGSDSTIVTSARDISQGGTGTIGGASPNWNYGQVDSLLGANAPTGTTSNGGATTTNGCSYPNEVATLFDQFNLAGVSWKGYAQDLHGAQPEGSTSWVSEPVPGRDDGLCGAPGPSSEDPATNPTYLSGAHGYPIASTLYSGTASGGSTTTLTVGGSPWTTNQFQSTSSVPYELLITGGTGAGEHATISSNTANTLTFGAIPTAPDATSTFEIGVQDTSSYTAASLEAGTGTANNPQYSDQYVAKHFPFPWFDSLTGSDGGALTEPAGGSNCDANHIANLDDPNEGLVHDLQNNTVPNFSWILPDNCSDAHDTTCKGNNLSGAFGTNPNGTVNLNDPIYNPPGLPSFDPEATTPRNYTGGLYASDLFLAYYVPLIEDSSAYQHGLIDVTFDEGEPDFTYSGNSFNNVLTNPSVVTSPPNGSAMPAGQGTTSPQASPPGDAPTFGASGTTYPGADSIFGAYDLLADAAGENISGTNVSSEPTGPNSTLGTDANGDQLYPGPGNNSFVDRPAPCGTGAPANCVSGLVLGGGGTTSSSTRTDTVTGSSSSNVINYPNPSSGNPSLVADDTGRTIYSITIGGTTYTYGTSAYNTAFPNGAFVGAVTDSGPLYPANSGGPTVSASFQMVDDAGNPVDPPASGNNQVTQVKLDGECDPATGSLVSTCTTPGLTADPIFDALDPTPGGGDTGQVLISPYIKQGTSTTTYYNHYSWLRTMEDLFDVSSCANTPTDVTLPAGTVCGGLDGQGHLAYAAQVGLTAFGSDVFSDPTGTLGFQPIAPPNALPEAPVTLALALSGLTVMGGFLFWSRRRRRAALMVR